MRVTEDILREGKPALERYLRERLCDHPGVKSILEAMESEVDAWEQRVLYGTGKNRPRGFLRARDG